RYLPGSRHFLHPPSRPNRGRRSSDSPRPGRWTQAVDPCACARYGSCSTRQCSTPAQHMAYIEATVPFHQVEHAQSQTVGTFWVRRVGGTVGRSRNLGDDGDPLARQELFTGDREARAVAIKTGEQEGSGPLICLCISLDLGHADIHGDKIADSALAKRPCERHGGWRPPSGNVQSRPAFMYTAFCHSHAYHLAGSLTREYAVM
ncbi:hypothetical protein BJ170DRAFT_716137, partial [Xylariales sp. AK1849]